MAYRLSRPSPYQGGASFNVFTAQGSNPTNDCQVCGKGIQKLYDKSVRTYIYSLCGKPFSKIQLPKDSKTGLHLLQPFIVLQVFVAMGQPFAFDLRVTDTTNTSRKMYFSTSFSDLKSTPLHCQIPISMVICDIWLSLSINVAEIFSFCFKGMVFRSIDTIVINPVCKIRKVFTMRNQLKDFNSTNSSFANNGEDYLPQEHVFALDVNNTTQVLDMATLQRSFKGLNDPTNGTQEEIMKLHKVKMNKLDSRQVHVAFGSRIPLALSTIQINTNLPSDNKPCGNKKNHKEREHIESTDLIKNCESPLSTIKEDQADKKLVEKMETIQNLLKHANSFNKNHHNLRSRRDQEILDLNGLLPSDEYGERSKKVQFINHEFKIPPHMITSKDIKCKSNSITAKADNFFVQASPNKDGVSGIPLEETETTIHLQGPNDEVGSKQALQSKALNCEAVNLPIVETNLDSKSCKETILTSKKKTKDVKSLESKLGLGKNTQRGFNFDNDRRKEYKQIRYLDSPPGSPPCGWKNCTKDDEVKPLKIKSFFNKICDDINDMKSSNDTNDDSLHSMASFDAIDDDGDCNKEGIKLLTNDNAIYNYKKKSMQDIENIISNINDEILIRTKKNLAKSSVGDFDSMFQDSKFGESMSYEDCGFRNKKPLDNDIKHEQHHPSSISHKSFNNFDDNNKYNYDALIPKDIWSKNNIEDSTFVKNSCKTLGTSKILKSEDRDFEDCNEDLFSSYKTYNDDDYFESNENKDLKVFIDKNDHLNLTYKDIKTPTSLKKISSTSLECKDSSEKKNESLFEHENPRIKDLNSALKHKDNERPNDDLDLLYDPTLDCYYDPKTNRYYELK